MMCSQVASISGTPLKVDWNFRALTCHNIPLRGLAASPKVISVLMCSLEYGLVIRSAHLLMSLCCITSKKGYSWPWPPKSVLVIVHIRRGVPV